MAHNLHYNNGRYSFAYKGEAAWHGLGQCADTMTDEEFMHAAGFGFTVSKVDALAVMPGNVLSKTAYFFTAREDTGTVFTPVTAQYKLDNLQPADVWQWMRATCEADPRFEIVAAGVLGNGGRLWATARFCDDTIVAGSRHHNHLLMSTSYDATQASRCEATAICVVCQNTLRMAHMGNKALVKARHSTVFKPDAVRRELADIVRGFEQYKTMGDALAQISMSPDIALAFFKDVLDIPKEREAIKAGDVSTRKLNQLEGLCTAFTTTQRERNTSAGDAWTALQAVTRYADHDRSVRGSDGTPDGLNAARFESATFGSGDLLKGKALGLLMPMLPVDVREKVLIPA